jgi:hypothetical protein
MNSDESSENEDHGDVISNGYVGIKMNSNGDPMGNQHKMAIAQADALKEAAKAMPNRPDGGTSEKSTQEECEAGGARVTAGSGRKDTCVARSHPSKT